MVDFGREVDIGIPNEPDNKDIYLELSHRSHIFPDKSADIDRVCTFMSGKKNEFGAWAEVVDSNFNLLSEITANGAIHVSALQVRSTSAAGLLHVIEIGYGEAADSVTVLNPHVFVSETKRKDSNEQVRFRSLRVPKGQKVFYRMKTENTKNATAVVELRYHTHA